MVAIKHEKKTPPPVGSGNQLLALSGNRSSTSPFSVSSAPSQAITPCKSSPAPSNSSSSGGQQPQSTTGKKIQNHNMIIYIDTSISCAIGPRRMFAANQRVHLQC